ncbi:MAG: hypothetical protein KY469_08265 [Actinobacteria bacterium]|nr:hypothetical protein [Actinomycetota bacterium]
MTSRRDRGGTDRRRRSALAVIVAIGLGLVAAPVVFQMFTRAPGGGRMLADFAPFMTEQRLDGFSGHLDRIGRATGEINALAQTASQPLPATDAMVQRWPDIESDMAAMIADIEANVDNYAAVAALPPFALFPWFFVLPGLAIAVVGWIALRRVRAGSSARGPVLGLVGLGVALVAAPATFQMFTRAPLGGEMIDDLRPLMTSDRVASIQGYFVTIGSFEGEVRTCLLPEAGYVPGSTALAADLPATDDFLAAWPAIAADMAPMIGAMADNVEEFAGIDALPPFPLFPWFFVVPGVLVAALAWWSRGGGETGTEPARTPRRSAEQETVP